MSTKHLSLLHCLTAVMPLLFWSSTVGNELMKYTMDGSGEFNTTYRNNETNSTALFTKSFSGDSCRSFAYNWSLHELPPEIGNMTGEPADDPVDVHVTMNVAGQDNGTTIMVFFQYPQKAMIKPKGFFFAAHGGKDPMNPQCYFVIIDMLHPAFQDEVPLYYEFPDALYDHDTYTVYAVSLPLPPVRPKMPEEPVVLIKTGDTAYGKTTLAEVAPIWSPYIVLRRLTDEDDFEVKFNENRNFFSGRTFGVTYTLSETGEQSPEQMVAYDETCQTSEKKQECAITYENVVGTFKVSIRSFHPLCNDSCAVTESDFYTVLKKEIRVMTTVPKMIPQTMTTTAMMTTMPATTMKAVTHMETTTQSTTMSTLRPLTHSSTTERTTVLETSEMITEPQVQAAMSNEKTKSSNNTLVGGLMGGLAAAGLFTMIVVLFAVMEKSKPAKVKGKKSTK
ncbi:uncharacterized protein LOC106053422 [Biomphalaria glabrata]|uniref:Uncharacterized protein LOC106053422 n=1 Tax=Biomphalaria glabrata TaxID=6526 RepID=A0A9W3A5U3_BIOGL|nr:uncharacterized protein LOC106053422 [Biomphalaria glabrata]XP_055882544.1 uncharacterized protein LOC106053422 [Biomphalaria glabrata]XP_055882545.1 uncharacterized protein LOC106053422 [Biomphalaria glabrata]